MGSQQWKGLVAGEAGVCSGSLGSWPQQPWVQEDTGAVAGQSASVHCSVLVGRCCQGWWHWGRACGGGETSCIS